METGPRLKVSSDRLVKPGIEPVTLGLQGECLIHNTTSTPTLSVSLFCFYKNDPPFKRTLARDDFHGLLIASSNEK